MAVRDTDDLDTLFDEPRTLAWLYFTNPDFRTRFEAVYGGASGEALFRDKGKVGAEMRRFVKRLRREAARRESHPTDIPAWLLLFALVYLCVCMVGGLCLLWRSL